jgi:hypothetical protein
MVRTQVQLTEKQIRRLRSIAGERGVSFSEALRQCLDAALAPGAPERKELYARAASMVGAFTDRDGATDVSSEHDRYLSEAFS